MELPLFPSVVTGLLIALLLMVLWLGPALSQRRMDYDNRMMARMHRYARRHNTFVRNANSVRFVVVLGTRGFHYMMNGRWVRRSQLLQAIGEADERLLLKAEGEESRQGPIATLALTQPA